MSLLKNIHPKAFYSIRYDIDSSLEIDINIEDINAISTANGLNNENNLYHSYLLLEQISKN